jgi:hypothetical protein
MIISKEKYVNNKLGIVAPFKDYNYGTVLQAYALFYLFQKQGVHAEYIDYVALDGTESMAYKLLLCFKYPSLVIKKLFRKQKVNPIVSFFSTESFRNIKEEYDRFITKIPASEKVTLKDVKKIEQEYSSFCVGSDQTWSPFVVDTFSINLLPFVKETRKKNSYAPSIGTTILSNSYKKKLKKRLNDFNVISCRDYYGSKMLSEILEKKVENVLDPTLLMKREDWESSIVPIESPRNYVLCYQLGVKENLLQFARKLGKEKGLHLVVIPTNEYTCAQPESLTSLSPGNFLFLVKNARYVVTDSFHGTIFSINFGVQFFSQKCKEVWKHLTI